MNGSRTVSVVIPTYYPDRRLRKIIGILLDQTCPVREIQIVNTDPKGFPKALWMEFGGPDSIVSVTHIPKEEFDHGGTRNLAASLCSGDAILFLTQDAIPADRMLVKHLTDALEKGDVAYARQIPYRSADLLERQSREFNYGTNDLIKTKDSIPTLGIKTFFCSNVCAIYKREVLFARGGFEAHTIFNEDMIFAGNLILDGGTVVYASKARVIHSHRYMGLTQFHRNFDLAVSQAQHPELFGIVSSEKEGVRMVKTVAGKIHKAHKPWLYLSLFWQTGWKYLGYLCGKRYRMLPMWVIRRMTWNREYWKKQEETNE